MQGKTSNSARSPQINNDYQRAKEVYSSIGINPDIAVKTLSKIKISIHCWQGDDVGGFETKKKSLDGGLVATGNYPGKARTPDELRQDAEKAFSLIPGKHKFNLHAIYLETNGKFVDRDEITSEHFKNWTAWAKNIGIGLDFNGTFFFHQNANSGFTLSHKDEKIRKFWIEHGKRAREITANFAKSLKQESVCNLWIPDGMKDFPADRYSPRKRLAESLDTIFEKKYDNNLKDSLEGKLFGIGSEEYVVGSNEFYISYAVSRQKIPCLDMGHFHPTEAVYDKISALESFVPGILLHVSRSIRWDSDHVVIFNDDLANLAKEVVRANLLDKIYFATDYFDASMNRVGAWVIGVRSLQKALLAALLEPTAALQKLELSGKNAEKLALSEEMRTMPLGAVWNHFCEIHSVPHGTNWIAEIGRYEEKILSKRG
jgi:L-rhamnose isomerase